MHVVLLNINLRLASRTLKEKRSVTRALIERLRNRYNAAVSEVGHLHDARTSVIAICCISNERPHVDSQVHKILGAVQQYHLDYEVLDVSTEHIYP